jgi:NAD(P)-dependent dehydrogenase (short-subunit alcohol dehydrogenase family)
MGRAGARVLLVDLDAERLATAAAAVAQTGAEVRTQVADVTREADVRAYVAAAVDAFGTIDVLFNNAAVIGPIGAIAEYDVDAFDRIMAINARGVFLGLRHVLPIMLAQRSGAVINTGSLSSARGLPGTPAYNAAKHAVLGLTRSAASEVASAGVRVNAVLPGMIDTPMLAEVTSGFDDPAGARRAAEGVSPQGRLGRPEEVAAVVTFLASDLAGHVNGVGWPVDGGILGTLPTAQPS